MNSFVFHEEREHGTQEFPCDYHNVDIFHPRYNMPFHWHKEWEIIRIVKGTFEINIDEHIFCAKENDILLIRDGALHGGTPVDCVYECFLFDLHSIFRNYETLKKYLRPIYRHYILSDIFYPAGKYQEIDQAVAKLSMAYQRDRGEETFDNPLELTVFGCISQIFSVILQEHLYTESKEQTVDNAQKMGLLKNVLEYIERNYANDISLDELANVAGMNPKYFCRYFRSIIHYTPIAYVNMYRVEKAAQMLHNTKLPITDICLECGFNDSSNFIKVFRKYKNVTPNKYRHM